VLNLPNLLTISRLLAIPVLMVLLAARFPAHDQWAAAVFLLSSLTDTADGQLARRTGRVTELGKFLDPLADKLWILSVLIMLVQQGELAAWVVVVIFGREMLITVLRSVSASQGHVIAATPWGKTKTVTQVGAVLLLILARPYPVIEPVAEAGVAVAVVFTVFSGLDYLWRFRSVILRPRGEPAEASTATGKSAVSASGEALAAELGAALTARRLSLAVAESCTGGLVGALITAVPGSSRYFIGGVEAYSNHVKSEQLGVPDELLERHGAVSEEVARAMAEGVRHRLHADLGLSVTGIAGPEADGTDKPVGLTFVWISAGGVSEGRRFVFEGGREDNRRQAAQQALDLAVTTLEALPRAVGG
jgi:CDP-diacylglycerol--glycerol-3-phosphate 3-phosphatidyltransferase